MMRPQADPSTRIPPQSDAAERAVLGAVLCGAADPATVRAHLPEAVAFYEPRHRSIWAAVLDLAAAGRPVDVLTVREALAERGALPSVTGSYIVELSAAHRMGWHTEDHAHIVREKALLRELARDTAALNEACFAPDADPLDVLEGMRRAADAAARALPGGGMVSMAESVEAALNLPPIGLDTGLTSFNRMTGGLSGGWLVCVAGRPGMGKSALADGIALHVARSGGGVAFFSLEMSHEQHTRRMLAAEAEVDAFRLRTQRLDPFSWERVRAAQAALSALPIFYEDRPALTPDELRAALQKLQANHPIALVVVDYLQLMHGRGDNRQEEVAHVSRSLKEIAKEADVPVLALAQLSRAVETRSGDKRPQLSDLRESGQIEQDCDVVAFLHRPEKYGGDATEVEYDGHMYPARGFAELIVAKQRDGPVGTAALRFEEERVRFSDYFTEPNALAA